MLPVQADREPHDDEAVPSGDEGAEPSQSVRPEGSEDEGEDLMDNAEA